MQIEDKFGGPTKKFVPGQIIKLPFDPVHDAGPYIIELPTEEDTVVSQPDLLFFHFCNRSRY